MFLFKVLLVVGLIYVLICLIAYFTQEILIFHPEVLPKDFVFQFEHEFEELFIEVANEVHLHALHFKAADSKGMVFYVHGNAGSLYDWGSLSNLYIELGYDLFMFDYRGFGKSDGKISSQQQFFDDVQVMYDYAKTLHKERNIIVEGFSIGTATAAKIAVENNPRHLILKAPYYTLPYLIKSKYPYLPSKLLKYQFMTVDFLKKVNCPATIFHGTSDELIPIKNAERLAEEVPTTEFVIVPNSPHNDIPYKRAYQLKVKEILQ